MEQDIKRRDVINHTAANSRLFGQSAALTAMDNIHVCWDAVFKKIAQLHSVQ
jgi:hypothetical protein